MVFKGIKVIPIMPKSKDVQKKYDLSAGTYNSRYTKTQQEKYRCALAGMELMGRVLDLGSGTGLLREFLKIDTIGADISFNMLKQGEEGAVQARAENLPFKDNSFDYVLSFSALMNFENPEAALKEVKRILKPEGFFILTFLKSFDFEKQIKKCFNITEKKPCGEDISYILRK